MDQPERTIRIKFTGRTADSNKVPALVLNQVLTGLQRSIHLLAMQHHEIETRRKERISSELEDKYVLLCQPPERGSFQIRGTLGDPRSDLFAVSDIETVSKNLQAFSIAAQKRDDRTIRSIMPDLGRRKRLLEALAKTIPKSSTGIHLKMSWNGTPFFESQQLGPALKELSANVAIAEEIQTVTGRLIRIDFEERKVTIQYRPSEREMECFYDESVEEMLLGRPRELIQVTGIIRLDENGNPKKIVDVQMIRELDLSRFYRESFSTPTAVLLFEPPLVLEPELVEDEQLIALKHPDLGIDVVAPTIEELSESLDEELTMLWSNYALADDATLSPKSIELKRNLLARIKEGVEIG
jgi:hypothetical protein